MMEVCITKTEKAESEAQRVMMMESPVPLASSPAKFSRNVL